MKKTIQGKANFLVLQESRHHFIEDNFNKALYLLSSKKAPSETECVTQSPREWPKLSDIKSVNQPLTQEQMRFKCKSIKSNVASDLDAVPKHKYTVIDFSSGSQCWDEQIFSLGNMILNVATFGDTTENYDFSKGDRLNAVVYIQSEYRTAQAFLKVIEADGNECFFELTKFSMIYNLCDNDDIEKLEDINDAPTSANSTVESKKISKETAVFTLFSRDNNLMFVTTY